MLRAQAAIWLDWLLFKVHLKAYNSYHHASTTRHMQSPEVCENHLKIAPSFYFTSAAYSWRSVEGDCMIF